MDKSSFFDLLTGNDKQRQIKTDKLLISGHLLRWEDIALQISNISMVSSGYVQGQKFPTWTIIAILIGMLLFPNAWHWGTVLLAAGGLCIALWYAKAQETKNHRFLHIQLNSGTSFSLLFEKKEFLNQVLDVFANIFEDGGQASGRNIHIDIGNCHIDSQSSLIGTLIAPK